MGNTAELILPTSTAQSRRASYRAKQGQITQLRRGVYVESVDPEVVTATVRARWMDIAQAILPANSCVAYRTAAELQPIDGEIFLVSPVRSARRVKIGDAMMINIFPGNTAIGVRPLTLDLSISAPARMCLENLTRTSGRRLGVDKASGREWVEAYLARQLTHHEEDHINALRDEARDIAPGLGMAQEYEQLNEIVRALLNTHPDGTRVLKDKFAIATARQEPFDSIAIERFRALAKYLERCDLDVTALEYTSAAWRHVSFIEAYFSNYIEGTEFTLAEAETIVFQGQLDQQRPADSHDILGTFDLTSDRQETLHTPESADDLIALIQYRHAHLMAGRPEVNPGALKTRANRAGNTYFVSPQNLVGTLTQAMPVYQEISEGLPRAIFIHFLIAECHPMADGNGRLSRLFLNAELCAAGLAKLIVPTVHRDSYLNSLRDASRRDQFRTMIKVMHQMHLYSASLPWTDYGDLLEVLHAHQADSEPDEGVGVFNRVISEWRRHYPPN